MGIVNPPLPKISKNVRIDFMAKKKQSDKNDSTFKVRCRQSDIDDFKERAEEDGFGGNMSAWILWNLRRIIKNSDEKTRST